ncbi:hypothetical protein PDJAM_G00169220, partial [Pangasius djambal]|nr:hypothetical protein [Pangasius djambal]
MLEQVTPYKPKNLAEDMILCAELREKGSKVTAKRLAKEQKGTYPQTGTPAECSVWWMQFKEGKKKDKMAMVVMASHYNHVVKLLDMWQSEVLQLKAKTKSQEEEIKLLKLKLQQRDEENRRLNYEMFNNSNKMLQLESKTTSHKEEIKLLKLKLLQWEEENMQLNYEMSKNSSKVLQLKSETDSLKEEITSIKLRVQEQNAENEQLKNKIANYNPSSDDS